MSYNYEDNIKCPYCGYESCDDNHCYESSTDDRCECDNCSEIFLVTGNVEVTYSTKRQPCKFHTWNKSSYNYIDQETCDRWNSENFCSRSNHVPHYLWSRDCALCDEEQSKSTDNRNDPWSEL